MAWIRTIDWKEATGLLRRLYDDAQKRAGKLFQVIQIQGLRPKVLRASTNLYTELMFRSEGGLTRSQREMIATVVSILNHCHY